MTPTVIGTLGGTTYYIISKGMVHIPLLMDNNSTCIVATEAFFVSKSPYKLLLESAFKKRKQLYIRPNKEIGSRMIWRYLDNFIVGRVTCINGLYMV